MERGVQFALLVVIAAACIGLQNMFCTCAIAQFHLMLLTGATTIPKIFAVG